MAKRTTRFYRRNEEVVMRRLGLKPTKNSGAGWVEKEDGQNEYLIAQLKSTDAESMKVSLRDIEILEYNAATAHKVPVFVIQFLKTDDTFIMMRPNDIRQVCDYIETGECEVKEPLFNDDTFEPVELKPKIGSSAKSRDKFWDQRRKEFENGKRRKV